MTTNQPDRLDRIETVIENLTSLIAADRQASSERVERDRQVSNERFRQIESDRERDRQQSNEQMVRLEQSSESTCSFSVGF